MKTRLFVLVTLFMMLFTASAFADVSGGSITKLRNTSDGQKIVIFTQEGYSVASVLEFVANKPMQASNVIEAVNAYLTQPGKVRILDEHTHSADNYIQIEYTHLTEEAANRPTAGFQTMDGLAQYSVAALPKCAAPATAQKSPSTRRKVTL